MKALQLAALTALCFCLSFDLAAAEKSCQLERLGVIKTQITGNGIVLVPVNFEGRDVWMALSMDRGVPSLFPGAVQELDLAGRLNHTEWDATVRGVKVNQEVKAKSLAFGGANFTGWTLLIIPVPVDVPKSRDGRPVVGILSSAFMNVVDVEFDLGAGEISLFKHKPCKGAPTHWEGEYTNVPLFVDPTGLLLFAMELDGKQVEASLNTGAGRSTLSTQVTRRYFGFDENSPGITHETVGAGRDVASFRAMALTAKGLNIKNTSVMLNPSHCSPTKFGRSSGGIGYSDCLNVTPLSIGTDLLKLLRIYLASAPSESMAYFMRVTPAGAPAEAPEPVH